MRLKSPLTVDEAINHLGFGLFQLRLLLLLGVVHTADAVANTIEPFLADHLDCAWGLQVKLHTFLPITGIVGVCIGAIGSGFLADLYFRRGVLVLSCFAGVYYISLSALAPKPIWFFLLRFCSNAAIAGIKGVALAYIIEFLPQNSRGKVIVTYQFFWTIGMLLVTLLLYLFMPTLSWRPMIFVTGLPLIVAGLITIVLPPSPYALVHHGKNEEASAVLLKIALINQVVPVENALREQPRIQIGRDSPVPNFDLETDSNVANDSGRSSPVTDDRMQWRRRLRFYLCGVIFCSLWIVYGFISTSSSNVTQSLPLTPHECLPADILMTSLARTSIVYTKSVVVDNSCCYLQPVIDLKGVAIEASHFALGGAIAFISIDELGRGRTMAFSGAFATILFLPLNFCLPSEARRILVVLSLSFSAALKSALAVYTLEIFPTAHRALGFGVCLALEEIGRMCAPFIVFIALPNNRVQYAYAFNTVVLLISAILAILLPYETTGNTLTHTAAECTHRLLDAPENENSYQTFGRSSTRRPRRNS